jgi:hypothetical protein
VMALVGAQRRKESHFEFLRFFSFCLADRCDFFGVVRHEQASLRQSLRRTNPDSLVYWYYQEASWYILRLCTYSVRPSYSVCTVAGVVTNIQIASAPPFHRPVARRCVTFHTGREIDREDRDCV